MARGGKRVGAGRKVGSKASHTLSAEKAREYIIERVTSELRPIMDKAIEQAKAGDQPSRRELMDRAYGKPREIMEHTGEIVLKIDI